MKLFVASLKIFSKIQYRFVVAASSKQDADRQMLDFCPPDLEPVSGLLGSSASIDNLQDSDIAAVLENHGKMFTRWHGIIENGKMVTSLERVDQIVTAALSKEKSKRHEEFLLRNHLHFPFFERTCQSTQEV